MAGRQFAWSEYPLVAVDAKCVVLLEPEFEILSKARAQILRLVAQRITPEGEAAPRERLFGPFPQETFPAKERLIEDTVVEPDKKSAAPLGGHSHGSFPVERARTNSVMVPHLTTSLVSPDIS